MTELLPYLEHLHPPTSCVNMELARFSPYFDHPDEWGITNIRPLATYRDIYPDDSVDIARIAYSFEYDHAIHEDAALREAHRKVVAQVLRWMKSWRRHALTYSALDDALLIADARTSAWKRHLLSGHAKRIWHYLDDVHTRTALGRRFPELDECVTDALLDTWQHRRWLSKIGERLLVTVPQKTIPGRSLESVA